MPLNNKPLFVLGLCALVLLAQLLVSEASAISNVKRKLSSTKINNNKISVTDVVTTTTIKEVTPNTVLTTTQTNLTILFAGDFATSCTRCLFNVSSTQNRTTIVQIFTNVFLTCPFPNEVNLNTAALVFVWLEDCQNQVYSDGFPLIAYSEAPTIQSVSPSNLYATGGMNATVTLQNPIDLPGFNSIAYLYCYFTGAAPSSAKAGYQTSDPTKVLCPVPIIPIGPSNLTVFWSGSSNVFLPIGIVTSPFTVDIRGNRIISASPTTACVLGGANITVSLENPTSTTTGVYCLFSAANDAGLIEPVGTTEAVIVGQSKFFCNALPWSLSDGLTAIVTLVSSFNYPLTSPIKFTYYANCARSTSSSLVCSLGNAPLTILGQGFPNDSQYAGYLRAVFWSGPSTNSFLIGYGYPSAANSTALSIFTTSVAYTYATYWIQVESYISGLENITSTPFLEIKNTNSCLSSVSPSVLNEDGGDPIVVEALMTSFGELVPYYCVFIDASDIKYSQAAKYVSPTQLTCVSPAVSGTGLGTLAVSSGSNPGFWTSTLSVKWV